MKSLRGKVCLLCAGLLVSLWGAVPCASAVVDEGVKQQQQIGIPKFPRVLKREAPEAATEKKMKLGIFRLHPSFSTSVQYDDNIFLTSSGETDDFIFKQTPGIEAHVRRGENRFEAAYAAEIINFSGNSEENSVNHLARGLMDLVFGNLNIIGNYAFEDTANRLFSETSARDHLQIHSSDVLARYDRPRWAAESGWRHNIIDHKTDVLNPDDFHEDIFAVLGGYKVLPRTLLLAEADLGLVRYDHTTTTNANQVYYQLFGGVRGEFSPKVTGVAKFGYQNRQMNDVSTLPQQEDFSGFVSEVNVLWQPRLDSAVRLDYVRTVSNSTYETNNWYREDRLSLSLRQKFLRKWQFTPTLAWQQNSYPDSSTRGGATKDRRDSFFEAGAGVRYQIQEWLSTGLAYDFRNRDSNLSVFDYDNNRVTFDVTAAF